MELVDSILEKRGLVVGPTARRTTANGQIVEFRRYRVPGSRRATYYTCNVIGTGLSNMTNDVGPTFVWYQESVLAQLDGRPVNYY